MAQGEYPQAEGENVLAAAVGLARQLWEDRLVAAYALGSLAHGGFSTVSDIDLGIVLRDPLIASDGSHAAELARAVKARNIPYSERLSVFWGSVASLSGGSSVGRFPPLDRLDLQKYGRLLTGRDVRSHLPLPSQRELVVAGAELALRRLAGDEVIEKLRDPEALVRCDQKLLTRLILWPLRFLFTARTADVGRNDAAVGHFAVNTKEAAAAHLARLALQWRDAGPAHSDQGAVAAIAAGVLPLYQEFLLDHEPRLREHDRPDLAEAFRDWRRRLLA